MQAKTNKQSRKSPYHWGEKEIQKRTGMADRVEEFGRRAIRPFMPEQHREFFAQLPFMVIGSVDSDGWPWSSVVTGAPGFAGSPNDTTLRLNTTINRDDPLHASMEPGAPLGLLGIELPTRRRNRLNARVVSRNDDGFTVAVDQSFGNCPQYIQTRALDLAPYLVGRERSKAQQFTTLTDSDRNTIKKADTFFVSSFIHTQDAPTIEGVDVSHRGGKPGFVRVEGDTLTIPDYTGNFLFNTMGNFLVNPKAGLVFINFDTGDMLMLTGEVEILWEDVTEVKYFKGAERAWRFKLKRGLRIDRGFPYRTRFGEYSPNTELTGTWKEAEKIKAAETKRNEWRQYVVAKIENSSEVIKSFYLEPKGDEGLLPFEAGQYLTLQIKQNDFEKPAIRTYTVSSAPGSTHYRLSVKREPKGLASNHLHDHLNVGDTIEAKAPRGDFFIDPTETRPAVLMAGGVGITPMMSMATHIANEGIRTRHRRPVTLFYAAQTTAQRAFYEDLTELANASEGAFTLYSFISRPEENQKFDVDFQDTGYITADDIRQSLPLDDYDFFLCGPPHFMQAQYDALRELGVRDVRIFAEAFGPATLKRQVDVDREIVVEEAEHAVIRFAESDFEQRWSAGDPTILEVAENHGLTPDYGCRSGACGSCAVKLKAGEVAYRTQPSAECAKDETIICCAVPAKGSDTVEIEL